MPITSKTSI